MRLEWPATAGSTVCTYELRYQVADLDAAGWPEMWATIDETIAGSATSYLHSGLDAGRRYRYQLRALNNVGAGDWSRTFPEAGARPGAPTLGARTVASGSVALSWVRGSIAALRWEYRQRPADGDWGSWTAIVGSDASTTEHGVSGLTEDARYQFQVRAVGTGGAGSASAAASAVAGMTPTQPTAWLRYSDYDASGGATAPGGFSLLANAADLSSGVASFIAAPTAAALLVNAVGQGGRAYAAVLNGVVVGGTLTWYAESGCWFAYRVTAVLDDPSAPARKLFAVTLADQGSSCADLIGVQGGYDYLIWRPPPNEPEIGADGIRILPDGYSVEGGHTYRLSADGLPGGVVIDVPAGMRVIGTGRESLMSGGEPTRFWLQDEASGAVLFLNYVTGREERRWIPAEQGSGGETRDIGALFDAIVESARRQPE